MPKRKTRYFTVTYTVMIESPHTDKEILSMLVNDDPDGAIFADLETAITGSLDKESDITVEAATAVKEKR